MIIIGNAFSIQMLDNENTAIIQYEPVSIEEVKAMLAEESYKSVIGHVDTANVVSQILDLPVFVNRESIKIDESRTLIIAQFMGGRLPEGATTLPSNLEIRFFKITQIPAWKLMVG
jgi:hypothetical protein